jgi:hypothetical protein
MNESSSTGPKGLSRIDALIDELIEVGKTLPAGLRAELLACAPDCVPHLIRVLTDEDLQMEDAAGDGWGPIHAARLLQELGPPDAIEPLIRAMRSAEADEYLSSAAMYALRACGPAAEDPTLAALEQETETYRRAALREVLAGLGERSDAIFEALKTGLEEHSELGAISLADYGDLRALPILQKALDDHEVRDAKITPFEHQEVIEFCEAIERLDGELTPTQQEKLKLVRRLREASRPAMEAYMQDRHGQKPQTAPPKPGRNDPCWCGSGKKYKKCHLGADRAR